MTNDSALVSTNVIYVIYHMYYIMHLKSQLDAGHCQPWYWPNSRRIIWICRTYFVNSSKCARVFRKNSMKHFSKFISLILKHTLTGNALIIQNTFVLCSQVGTWVCSLSNLPAIYSQYTALEIRGVPISLYPCTIFCFKCTFLYHTLLQKVLFGIPEISLTHLNQIMI